MRAVAWPIQVTRIIAPSTLAGGTMGVTGTWRGQIARSSELAQRLKKLRPGPLPGTGPSELKKRSPSKWSLADPT